MQPKKTANVGLTGVPTVRRRPPPDAWDQAARRLIRSKMALGGISYKALAASLAEHGYGSGNAQTLEAQQAALSLRIKRGTFSMGFALLVLRVMDVPSLDISHLKLEKHSARG